MITQDKVTKIYSMADDFCKFFSTQIKRHTLEATSKSRKYHRDNKMSDAEIIIILILFHMMGYRCLKHFYLNHVCVHMHDMFPNTVSYSRFVALQQSVMLPLTIFVKEVLLGKCTGITFVDSTPLRVCRQQRIHCHKVFKGIATRGQCSMWWFFGFKLHLICNDKGELVGGKGYISKKLFEKLFIDGIQLITKIKKNMKNCLMSSDDKILLRKRAVIETINDELKNICQIEHSRHRSFSGFVMNLLSGLAAYCYFPKKPSIRVEMESSNQLTLF